MHLVEKSKSAVIIFLRDRIVFMVMAFGTFKGECQESFAKSVGPVSYIFDPVFFIDHTAFLGDFVVPVESGSQLLFPGGIGEEVTGQLPV